MTTAIVVVGEETEPTWEPEAGYGMRTRRDRRKKALCEVCKRPIWGDGRLCRGSYVNEAAIYGCTWWWYMHAGRRTPQSDWPISLDRVLR